MSSSQEQQERSFRRLVAANILTKVAMYCLAFGLLLLCTGGIRSCFLPASSSSQLLIIIGIVAALLGVVHTIIAIFVMKSIRGDITPSTVWSMGRTSRPSRSEIRTVSRHVADSQASSSSSSSQFTYSNPALVAAEAEDLKYWEPPPSYEVATKQSGAVPSVVVEGRTSESVRPGAQV